MIRPLLAEDNINQQKNIHNAPKVLINQFKPRSNWRNTEKNKNNQRTNKEPRKHKTKKKEPKNAKNEQQEQPSLVREQLGIAHPLAGKYAETTHLLARE